MSIINSENDGIISTEFEQLLLTAKECFVYKVPPLKSASGHRAEDWGLDHPLFTGCLKVFQIDVKLKISIYRYNDPASLSTASENILLFAEAPIQVPPAGDITPFVDSVIDSSRYYVVKVKDPASSRTMLLGIGFRERDLAFDFKNALNDYVRYVDRMAKAEKMAKTSNMVNSDTSSSNTSNTSSCASSSGGSSNSSLALKEGEKIKVPIKASNRKHSQGSMSASLGLLPPPPPGSVVYPTIPSTTTPTATTPTFSTTPTSTTIPTSTSATTSSSNNSFDEEFSKLTFNNTVPLEDEDWGDFGSSTSTTVNDVSGVSWSVTDSTVDWNGTSNTYSNISINSSSSSNSCSSNNNINNNNDNNNNINRNNNVDFFEGL